jgi:S1-C subfamily serine protease
MMLLGLLLAAMLEWPAVLPPVAPQIPRVEMRTGDSTGVCSAVVYAVEPDHTAYAVTAAHCVAHDPMVALDITVNGRTASVVTSNRILDLAVLKFRAKHETAMPLAEKTPALGEDVAIVGFAFGDHELAAQFGHVARVPTKDANVLLLDGMIIGGDSGGAAIDRSGHLIGLNSHVRYAGLTGQMMHVAGVVPIEAIKDFLESVKR